MELKSSTSETMDMASQTRQMLNIASLEDLAIYLSGYVAGKGNLLPLGTIVIDDLWDTIKYLQGDVRFIA